MTRPRRRVATAFRTGARWLALSPVAMLAGVLVSSPAAPQPAMPSSQHADVGQAAILVAADGATQGSLLHGRIVPATAQLTLDGAPVAVAPDGAFIIGFDRDAPAQAHLALTLADGSRIDRVVAVAPGGWRIEQVDASLTGGAATTAEFQARRARELEQIAAARATPVVSDGWRQAFIWPVHARLSGQFGAQRIYRGTPASFHTGTDLAAALGTVFVAPADGVVTLAADAPFTLEGNLLIIDHGMGLTSAFLHCSRLDVHVGDVVRQGQPLGLTGATGRASGPHLHWGMKWNAARIDAARVVAP